MRHLVIKFDDKTKTVSFDDFVSASVAMLRSFGLTSSEEHAREQIESILSGGKLDIIGVFLKDYVVKEAT